jgi:3-phosphoshikimate 1-carboxyvinyltransferase
MTLAAIAPFASSKTTITGISHIQYQECDRLHAILNELTRTGISCREINNGDGIEIIPGTPKPAEIETYDDHRMAMAFAPCVYRYPQLRINHPEVVSKSYPTFWQHLESL